MKSVKINSSLILIPTMLLALTVFASTKGTLGKLYTAFDGDLALAVVLSSLIVLTGFIATGFGATMFSFMRKEFSWQRLIACVGGFAVGFLAIGVSLWTESSYSIESLREVNSSFFETKDKIQFLEAKMLIAQESEKRAIQTQISFLKETLSRVGDGWILMCEKFGIDIHILIILFFGFTELAGAFCGYLSVSHIVNESLSKIRLENNPQLVY